MRENRTNEFYSVDPNQYTCHYFMHSGGAMKFLRGELGEIYVKVLQLTSSLFTTNEQRVILDVGCGRGELLREYAKKGYVCYGIDYAPAAVALAKATMDTLPQSQLKNTSIQMMDVKRIDFEENMFDAIFMLDIVEHLYQWELECAIPKIYNLLKPNGILIIHTYPTRWLINTIHFAMSLIGLKSTTKHLHPNPQTMFSMEKILKPYFRYNVKTWYEKRYNFWSQNLSSDYNVLLKNIARVLDCVFDNRLFSVILKTPLKHFFATDIWVVATKVDRKNNLL